MHGHDWSTFSGPSHRGNGLTTFRQAGLRGAHALRGGRGSCFPSSSSFWEEPEPEASKQEVVHGCAVHGEKHWAARVWAVKSRAATATARSAVERPMKHRGSRAGGAEGGPGAPRGARAQPAPPLLLRLLRAAGWEHGRLRELLWPKPQQRSSQREHPQRWLTSFQRAAWYSARWASNPHRRAPQLGFWISRMTWGRHVGQLVTS